MSKPFNLQKYISNEHPESEVVGLKEAFDHFDDDKSGEISTVELQDALKKLGVDPNNQTLVNMMAELDEDGSGEIDFGEFFELMTAKMSEKDTRDDLKKVFRLFLAEGDREDEMIERKTLIKISKSLDLKIPKEDIDGMIKTADKNNDHLIDFEEFYSVMTRKRK